MKSIQNLIEKLIANPTVVGLMEYGGARYQDEQIYGDYDLFVFLPETDPDVESIHFYINDTPVDLNLRILDDIQSLQRAEGFDTVLLDGRIIYDPSGDLSKAIQDLQERQQKYDTPGLAPTAIGRMRHGGKHALDKLKNGRYASTALGYYILHQLVYWALKEYFSVRRLPYRGEKQALKYLRQNEPALYDCFEKFYLATDFELKMQLAQTIDQKALEPIGGPWHKNEILAFGDQAKGNKIYNELFQERIIA